MAAQIRLRQWSAAEARLLVILGHNANHWHARKLLLLLALLRRCTPTAAAISADLSQSLKTSDQEFRFLQANLWLQQGSLADLESRGTTFWDGADQYLPLALARIAFELERGHLADAQQILDACASTNPCLEVLRLQARIWKQQERQQEALDLLLPCVPRFPQHIDLIADVAALLIEARSREHTIPFLRQALAIHGEHPALLPQVATVKLLQRQPALARRAALMERAWDSIRAHPCNPANLVITTEQLGCGDWMQYLHPAVHQLEGSGLTLRANLCMQLASVEAAAAEAHTKAFVQELRQRPGFAEQAARAPLPRLPLPPGPSEPLTVAWITGDLANHPVARFLLNFFAAADGALQHRHLLVSTQDHQSESLAPHFAHVRQLSTIPHLGTSDPNQIVGRIRELQPHIAIDLSGWTGGNLLSGFMAGLAPCQLTYLGYFASTGVPEIQHWLGDAHLFPTPMQEWHTEQIERLERCFIAWQPAPGLPEANACVTSAPAGGIRFGSFNNNRKLSDPTLALWGAILKAIPGSSLVLKANAADDPGTQELLRRRMLRQGLDPTQVLWLPLAASSADHLQQYAEVDVALDCFPNGGCTTTCEALWMGVPVITLTGRSYVSRMSTAVLHGAGLPEWCVSSPQAYLNLAIAQASQLTWLRQRRDHWRQQVLTHPLGDAAGLMASLEACFSRLYARTCAANA